MAKDKTKKVEVVKKNDLELSREVDGAYLEIPLIVLKNVIRHMIGQGYELEDIFKDALLKKVVVIFFSDEDCEYCATGFDSKEEAELDLVKTMTERMGPFAPFQVYFDGKLVPAVCEVKVSIKDKF